MSLVFISQLIIEYSIIMSKKFRQQLGVKVAKAIAKTNCTTHCRSIDTVCLQSLKLGCEFCSFPSQMNIQDALKNPIQIVIAYLGIDKSASFETIKSLRTKQQHKKVKIGFESIVLQIKNKVSQMCQKIIQKFNLYWNATIGINQTEIQEIKRAQQHYKSTFEELLQANLQQGSVSQLQDVLYQFCNKCSEDPSQYTKTRIQQILAKYETMPVIDWDSLKTIYETITDPNLWSLLTLEHKSIKDYVCKNEIMQNKKSNVNTNLNLLLSNQINELKNSEFKINYENKSVKLYQNENDRYVVVSELRQNYDQIYEIENNKLVGINYEGISIIAYSFGNLKACSNLLVFPECFIAEAEGRIIRVWRADKFKEVISLSGGNPTYTDNPYQFQFTNGKGEILTRPVYHGQI